MWPILAQLLPKYGPRIAIFNNLSVFFQNYNMITQVININWMSQHISLEISKKNPWWVELKGKICPNSTIKHQLPDLLHLRKVKWWISRIFTEPSSQVTCFFAGTCNFDGGFLLIFFSKWQQLCLALIYKRNL